MWAKAVPLFSTHAHVQRGGASVREYPYPAVSVERLNFFVFLLKV